MRSAAGFSIAALLVLVLGLDAGAAQAIPASVTTPRAARAPSVTKVAPVVSRGGAVGMHGVSRPPVVGAPPKFAPPLRGIRTSAGTVAGTSRPPVSRASRVTPIPRGAAVGSAHPGVLGGPARYNGRQGGVLTGTGLKRRPTAP